MAELFWKIPLAKPNGDGNNGFGKKRTWIQHSSSKASNMLIKMVVELCKQLACGIDAVLRRLALWLLAAYQYALSPWLGGACRFAPTCSQYAKAVFQSHPTPVALWLTVRRLAKCHPFCEGGEDPPPMWHAKIKKPQSVQTDSAKDSNAALLQTADTNLPARECCKNKPRGSE